MKRLLTPIQAVAVCWGFALLAGHGAEPSLIRNGDFEAAFGKNGVAAHWMDNSSWAPVKVSYESETAKPHSGKSCQKIVCSEFKGGAVQFIQQLPTAIGKYRKARISLALRGEMQAPVEVILRKHTRPYTSFISRSFPVASEWQAVSFEEILPGSAADMILVIRLTGVGTVYLDDITVTESELKEANPFTQMTPPKTTVPPEFFGMHIHRPLGPNAWPTVPFAGWRLWDAMVSWAYLQPKKDTWAWDRLDSFIAKARENHIELTLPLALTPTWASARPTEPSAYNQAGNTPDRGWAAEPADLETWKASVRTIATHCKGSIRIYEMWNEPNNNAAPSGFFTGTPEKLAELCRAAYAILKEVDPGCTVVSPSIVNDTAYLERFLAAGGTGTFDKVGYHFYVGYEATATADRCPEKAIAEAIRLRQMLQRRGIGDRAIWNTESGWLNEAASAPKTLSSANPKSVPFREFGDFVARHLLLLWGQGIERCYLYSWDSDNMGFIEKDGSLKPGAVAYRTAREWMLGNRMESLGADGAENWIAVFAKPDGGRFRIVWRAEGESKIDISGWKARQSATLYGETKSLANETALVVTASPVRVE